MEQKPTDRKALSLWERFLGWLDGDDAPGERVRVELPKTGDTVRISSAERKKLEEAVTTLPEHRWDTAFYSRDTEVRNKSAKSPKPKDSLII